MSVHTSAAGLRAVRTRAHDVGPADIELPPTQPISVALGEQPAPWTGGA